MRENIPIRDFISNNSFFKIAYWLSPSISRYDFPTKRVQGIGDRP